MSRCAPDPRSDFAIVLEPFSVLAQVAETRMENTLERAASGDYGENFDWDR